MKNTIRTTADVLIVDDYEPNLLALRATLDGPQYRLFEAVSGAHALELCKTHEFALIILDVQMPGMDGFEAAKQIKATSLNKECGHEIDLLQLTKSIIDRIEYYYYDLLTTGKLMEIINA